MEDCTLIFPHQLFQDHPAIGETRPVLLVEEELFFKQYQFHQQKIILHRASMKAYEAFLKERGCEVHYIQSTSPESSIKTLVSWLGQKGTKNLHLCDPSDFLLQKRLKSTAAKMGLTVHMYEGPDFLTPVKVASAFFNEKRRYHQTDFYIFQRKRLSLLMDNEGKPLEGKWSFDADNRKKLPKDYVAPKIRFPQEDEYVTEAIAYVKEHFSNNLGISKPQESPFPWAWKREDALALMHQFIEERLKRFGDYEDAFTPTDTFLQHSVLSPMLNIGLLTPKDITDAVIRKHADGSVPFNATEGFIRQIIGWREFIRIVYQHKGSYQRTNNYWGFKRKIPPSFYKGTTGILPVDDCIRKLQSNAYLHHIERLMILGNFFLLCEFDPDEVCKWFMELFIDAYDWVMVPNIYGMTQFADGGLMTTKPYISGSNYLFKMGSYKKPVAENGMASWADIWDGLFWRFMDVHRDFFLTNPRLGMLVKTYDKMDDTKKRMLRSHANGFLEKLDRELM